MASLLGLQGCRTWKLASAIALSLLHLGSQAAAIYAVYWYGRQMESTGIVSVPLLHIDINLKEQTEWLWAIVIFSTACFVISAALMFLSRQLILNLVQQHYGQSLEKLVLLTLRLPDPRVRLASVMHCSAPRRGMRRSKNSLSKLPSVGADGYRHEDEEEED